MGVNSLPKTVTRQRRGWDLDPGPSAPESSSLTTRPPGGVGECIDMHNQSVSCSDSGTRRSNSSHSGLIAEFLHVIKGKLIR